jgi:uncharacterized protein
MTTMSARENKRLLQTVFAALADGHTKPFRDAMADDFRWTITGSSEWSGTYVGRDAVIRDLFSPLFAQFADRYTNRAHRILAEGDFVVVECQGRVTTRSGRPYNNSYCYVCRLANGKLDELTEYCDTALIERVLAPPGRPPATAPS